MGKKGCLPYNRAMRKTKSFKFQQMIAFVAFLFIAAIACGNKDPVRPTDAAVLESYQKIHAALAADTVNDVSESASAISKAVREDAEKKLPLSIAEKAEQLSKATEIKAARETFKALSADLISYLEKQKIQGTGYHQTYCPMVQADWLQKEKKIINPYYGKSMAECGEIKRTF
jgi:hypothetical protein